MKNKGVKLIAMLAIIATMMSTSIVQVKAAEDTYICKEYQGYIYQISNKYGICPEVVMAIIERESSGKATVVDESGKCHGLMQINLGSHKGRMQKLGVTDIYDPYSNILVGVDYLSEILESEECLYTALMRYHGESEVSKDKISKYSLKIIDRACELRSVHSK